MDSGINALAFLIGCTRDLPDEQKYMVRFEASDEEAEFIYEQLMAEYLGLAEWQEYYKI